MNPTDPIYGDNFSQPPIEPIDDRAKLQARIENLERDLGIIQRGKEAAERCLKYERERARELAQNGTLSLKRDWIGLVNEFKLIQGQFIENGTEKDTEEYQEALAIDFVNRLRMGFLADFETEDNETLFVKSRAYEVAYKCCTYVLKGRAVKIKIDNNVEFDKTQKEIKERKIAEASSKHEKRRRTPEEKIVESCMALGMTEEQAYEHIRNMKAQAKDILTPTNK